MLKNRKKLFLSNTADASMLMLQSTVVQTSYAPQIQPGVNGMIVDMTEASVQSWNCETSAGIPFGVAVGQGAGDAGCVLGGAAFVGIAARSVTLALANIDPMSNTNYALDTYGLRETVAVMSRGHMWVIAAADVIAGNPVFYDQTTGKLAMSSSGAAATGSVVFTTNPAPSSSITLNGTAITFVASGATGEQVNIGPTLGDTILNLANFINANAAADIQVAKFKALAYPQSPGGAGQGSGANTLMLAAPTVGVGGNALTVATNVVGATVSGGTLSGGAANTTTQITGARWASTAIAGQLAQVSLGIQT